MENQFHGFDHLKPDQALKDKTKEQILVGTSIKMSKPSRPILKAAIAACLTIVVVGGSTAAFFLGGFNRKSESLSNGGAINGDAAMPDEDSPIAEDTTMDIETEFPADKDDAGIEAEDSTDATIEFTNGSEKPIATASKATATASKTTATASKSAALSGGGGSKKPAAGLLTAKMWNDNLNFSDWLTLLGQDSAFRQYQQNWGINLTKRIAVTVKSNGSGLPGASITLLDPQGKTIWSAVSDNTGKAYLFYNVLGDGSTPARIIAKYKDKTIRKDIANTKTDTYTIDFADQSRMATALDLMFVCDTTGSMGDELSYLQTELEDIILRVTKQNGNIPLRLSVNFYRDEGDQYVVRPFPFTTDVNRAISNLKQQYAAQGGDFEEAVDQALNDAIHNHEWSSTATAKLLFLVLDAPPHNADKATIQKLLADAAKQGIRVIPVTASGIDKNTEYLMRAFGVGTGGTYVALTNDSGVGGDHVAPSVGETQVYKLNDLLVKIINDYLQ